jgi:hypothetical protein
MPHSAEKTDKTNIESECKKKRKKKKKKVNGIFRPQSAVF